MKFCKSIVKVACLHAEKKSYMVESTMLPQKIAFVDIETTGLGVTHDRIIEVGILRVENNKVVKTFQTVLNPQGSVSPFVNKLTGITGEELVNAPTFYEKKDEILEILEGCVFVAHNVRFDYGFLKNEFKRYDTSFSAKHFCTVKLSQALFPEFKKHNLDAIIERFDIACKNRHRAFDDAKVLWDFYQKLQGTFAPEMLEEAINGTLKKPSRPLAITEETMDLLPEKPGVYIFYADSQTPLYVGKSVNIRERVKSHFANDHTSTKEMKIAQQIQHIETITTSGELGALMKESQLIKKLQPLYNRQLRIKKKLIILKKIMDKDGYPEVSLETVSQINPDDLPNMLGIFTSKRQAQSFLVPLVKEYSLCEKLVGLEKTTHACFAYRLNICKGACVSEESPLSYAIRFTEAFTRHTLKPWPFPGAVVIQEQNALEHTGEYFVVDKWCLLAQYEEHEDLLQQTNTGNYVFDLDTYKLLVRFLEKKQNWKHVKLLNEPPLLTNTS